MNSSLSSVSRTVIPRGGAKGDHLEEFVRLDFDYPHIELDDCHRRTPPFGVQREDPRNPIGYLLAFLLNRFLCIGTDEKANPS
jgi:hypothetical protein